MNYKKGDTVKVVRRFKSIHGFCSWVRIMDDYIGETCTILDIDEEKGMKIYKLSSVNISTINNGYWFFAESFDKKRKEKFERIINNF